MSVYSTNIDQKKIQEYWKTLIIKEILIKKYKRIIKFRCVILSVAKLTQPDMVIKVRYGTDANIVVNFPERSTNFQSEVIDVLWQLTVH